MFSVNVVIITPLTFMRNVCNVEQRLRPLTSFNLTSTENKKILSEMFFISKYNFNTLY